MSASTRPRPLEPPGTETPPPGVAPGSLDVFPSPAPDASRRSVGGKVFLLTDAIVIAAAICATVALAGFPWAASAVLALSSAFGLYLAGCYDERVYHRANNMSARLLFGMSLGLLATSTISFFVPATGLGRTAVLVYHIVGLPALVLWRRTVGERLRARLAPIPVAVLGYGPGTNELESALSKDQSYRVDIEFRPLPTGEVEVVKYGRPAGRRAAAEISTVVAATGIRMIAVAPAGLAGRKDIYHQIILCKRLGVEVRDIGPCVEMLTRRLPIRHVDDWWVALSFRFLGWGQAFDDRLKRMVDIVFAASGLLLLFPVLLVVAAAVLATSGRPVIFRQERIGFRSQRFVINKFRTMVVGSERVLRVSRQDARVTPLGAWLRRTHLDELPQLWNVLRGDMSLVGPRPELCELAVDFGKRIPYYDLRHIVKPGITGLAQVECDYCQTVAGNEVKLEYDLHYVRYRNTLWDMWILLKTLFVAFKLRGSRP